MHNFNLFQNAFPSESGRGFLYCYIDDNLRETEMGRKIAHHIRIYSLFSTLFEMGHEVPLQALFSNKRVRKILLQTYKLRGVKPSYLSLTDIVESVAQLEQRSEHAYIFDVPKLSTIKGFSKGLSLELFIKRNCLIAKADLAAYSSLTSSLNKKTPFKRESAFGYVKGGIDWNHLPGAIHFLTKYKEHIVWPGIPDTKFSEFDKLVYIWENKKRYVAVQSFLLFAVMVSVTSPFLQYKLWHLLIYILFWMFIIIGVGVDSLFFMSLGSDKKDECMGMYRLIRPMMVPAPGGLFHLVVNCHVENHIEWKHHSELQPDDISLGRYQFLKESPVPLVETVKDFTKTTYNNFGYALWFFDRDLFSIEGQFMVSGLCRTKSTDVEFNMLNFHYFAREELLEVFELVYKEVYGAPVSKHQNNKQGHLRSMCLIKHNFAPDRQMNKRFNNCYVKIELRLRELLSCIRHSDVGCFETQEHQVPIYEEISVPVEKTEIITVEEEADIPVRYQKADLMVILRTAYEDRIKITSKYLDPNEPQRRHTNMYKNIIKCRKDLDKSDPDWVAKEDGEICLKKLTKIEKERKFFDYMIERRKTGETKVAKEKVLFDIKKAKSIMLPIPSKNLVREVRTMRVKKRGDRRYIAEKPMGPEQVSRIDPQILRYQKISTQYWRGVVRARRRSKLVKQKGVSDRMRSGPDTMGIGLNRCLDAMYPACTPSEEDSDFVRHMAAKVFFRQYAHRYDLTKIKHKEMIPRSSIKFLKAEYKGRRIEGVKIFKKALL